MVKKIYLTGCARSGTTLLARLFYAFEGVQIINDEISLLEFANIDTSEMECQFLIGKRTENTIFSNTLSQGNIDKHLELLDGIIVINCVRDGRQVVESWWNAWGMYDPFAWMNAIKQSKEHEDYIEYTCYYEDLANDPNEIQRQLSEIGLKIKYKFTDYPEFVPVWSFPTENEKYKLTSITYRSNEDPQKYMERPNDIEYFNNLLKQIGYVRD